MSNLKKSRLYELLENLSLTQRESILNLLSTPTLKHSSSSLYLLRRIIEHINNSPNKPLYRNELILQRESLRGNFNRIMSDLFLSACRSLYLLKIFDTPNSHLELTSFFINKSMTINTKQSLIQLKSTLNKRKNQSHLFHLHKSMHHELCLTQQKDNRDNDKNLIKMNEHIDAFYAESKLRLLCEETSRNRITKNISQIFTSAKSIKLFLEYLSTNNFFSSFSTITYYSIFVMLRDNNYNTYNTARDNVFTCLEKYSFSQEVEETLIAYMMNQCIYFINHDYNVTQYAKDYIQYISLLEDKGFLLTQKKLRISRFNGGIFASVIANEIDWLINFVEKYHKKVDKVNFAFIKQIHFAYIEKIKGNINIALDNIRDLKVPKTLDPFFAITYYKICFEIYHTYGDYDNEVKTINSLYKYIKTESHQKKVSGAKINAVLKFISYARKLIKRIPPGPEKDKLKQNLLNEAPQVAYSYWLKSVLKV